MNVALNCLRSIALGALGGLGAIALAGWLGLDAPPAAAASPAPVVQPMAHRTALAAHDAVAATDTARRFIAETACASLYEAQAARLMHETAADADVQQLAATLLRGHEAAWPALRTLADRSGVALPTQLTPEQHRTLQLMRDVADHTRAHLFVRAVGLDAALAEIARYELALDALRHDADTPLRGWIEQTLPTLRERVALSQRLLPRVAERRPMA